MKIKKIELMIDKIVDGEADTALNRIENNDRFRA
ncbi:hypothetical protein DZE40_002628 [Clostridium beijerinckii]|uniref:Uncharacterized protein n=1 Tax=Clostridium beijerinckii TaxID=1520 RepID=A0A1S8RZ28_CLOBE|nr:hypothetical protein [Clostridium beijerinckii]OOM58467.1 hypothetical protein CLBCK_40450 [Clostridium beijerinckii]